MNTAEVRIPVPASIPERIPAGVTNATSENVGDHLGCGHPLASKTLLGALERPVCVECDAEFLAELYRAESGKCPECGDRLQLVERTTVWYPLDHVSPDGVLIFDGGNFTKSDDGDTDHIECSSCLTVIHRASEQELPAYDWL